MKYLDTLSKEKRHDVMSKIKSKDTSIEIQVRHWLYSKGLRYRKNCGGIAGKPDIAIRKYKIAIFVHGCFWHRHGNCRYTRCPKTNVAFWEEKFEKNIKRDQRQYELLNEQGWRVFVVWECQIKSDFESTMNELYAAIKSVIEETHHQNGRKRRK